MITKILTATLITLFSTQAFSFADEGSSQRLSNTQGASTSSPLESKYSSLIKQLEAHHATGSVNCNTSYNDSAHASICSCGNESGHEPLSGKVKKARTVLSRVKSPDYPDSVRGVICQREQFSWTIGILDQNCRRTSQKSGEYFNTYNVRGDMLNSCVQSIKIAAKEEFLSNPDQLFALNYASSIRAAYRGSPVPAWAERLIASQGCDGNHCFGFANASQNRPVNPNEVLNRAVVKASDFIQNLLTPKAHALLSELKIVNTKSKNKIYLNDTVKKLLTSRSLFKTYSVRDFNTAAKNLMNEKRDNLPMALTGDFNGDDKIDLVLFGQEKGKSKILSFVSHKNLYKTYDVLTIDKDSNPLNSYIAKISSSKINLKDGKARDAFQYENFGGSVREFYFTGDRFEEDTDDMISYKRSVKPTYTVPTN